MYVSNKKSQNAPTIYTILQKLVPTLRELVPSTKVIHYWTDSPTSQYHNKNIFYIIAHHEELMISIPRQNKLKLPLATTFFHKRNAGMCRFAERTPSNHCRWDNETTCCHWQWKRYYSLVSVLLLRTLF